MNRVRQTNVRIWEREHRRSGSVVLRRTTSHRSREDKGGTTAHRLKPSGEGGPRFIVSSQRICIYFNFRSAVTQQHRCVCLCELLMSHLIRSKPYAKAKFQFWVGIFCWRDEWESGIRQCNLQRHSWDDSRPPKSKSLSNSMINISTRIIIIIHFCVRMG